MGAGLSGDALALWHRYHDNKLHAQHSPKGATARAVFEATEQARVEALGANREGHAAQRLRRRIEHAAMSESRFWSRVSDLGVALRRKHDVPHAPSEAASKGREV